MTRFTTLLGAALTLLLCAGVSATVLHVPGEYPTIQAGIDAAVEGDTVLVADGTYTGDGNRDIDFLGKAIVVISENGPEVTVVDCEGDSLDPHRGFFFHSGEDLSSVLRGFTVQNGFAYRGGGMRCDYASPTIAGNWITRNTASGGLSGWGGGIHCYSSSPRIEGNMITGNMASGPWGGAGGGVYCDYASPMIVGNTIAGNTASASGSARGGGGGICCLYASFPTLAWNRISGNEAYYGGGIYCYESGPVIVGNTISGNVGELAGGGMYFPWGSSSLIGGNTISGNEARIGGGILCHASSLTINGNTMTRNAVTLGEGGAIHCYSCSLSIINSILWGDSPSQIEVDGDTLLVVAYCDVEGGWSGEGNIDADPMFVLAEKGDYRLLWGSPCIDAGHPDSLDADGTRRDMGAEFFDQEDYMTLYLTPDTTEVSPGAMLGVTYTAINRWPQAEPFWVQTEATLPNGSPFTIIGPDQYTLPANTTVQRHLHHMVPGAAPLGAYGYGSRIGMPPSMVYDEDSFGFAIVPPPVE